LEKNQWGLENLLGYLEQYCKLKYFTKTKYAMKKLILITLTLLFFNSLYSQQEFLWQNEFLSRAEKVAFSEFDNTWIVTGSDQRDPIGNWSYGYSYLAKIDTAGNLLWQKKHLGTQEVTKVQALEVLDNGKIILSVNWNLCDVYGTDSLYLFSPNGQLLKKSDGFQFTSDFQPLDNKDFIVAHYGKVQCIDTNLNVIWTYNSGTFYDNTILKQAPNGNIFAFMEDSILNFHSTTGILTNYYETNIEQEGVAQIGEFFYTIDENKMVLFMDTAFNFGFATFDVSPYFDEVYKADMKSSSSNQLYVLGKKNASSTFILLSNGISPTNTFVIDTSYQFISDFALSDNQVAVVGGDFSDEQFNWYQPYYPLNVQRGSAHSFFKTTDFSLTDHNSGIDIGITDIQFNQFSTSQGNCTVPYMNYDFTNVQVVVKNFGTTPVQEFNIYGRFENTCSSICINTIQIKRAISINTLQPGDSATVSLNNVNIPFQANIGSLDLCFWTGEAVNKLDVNHDNDKYCSNVLLINTEQQFVENSINILPNPANHFINIELSNAIQNATIEIYNSAGQLQISQSNLNVNDLQNLNISALVNGFYILKITNSNNDTYIGKFIKQ